MTNLTVMEIKVLNGMRQNEYNDALEDGRTWSFTAIDNSGVPAKQARGVISSLVKKGLVGVDNDDENEGIWFTDTGKALYDNADGEDCSWGGPKLLKELAEVEVKAPAKKRTKKVNIPKAEVTIVAFTNMLIGTFVPTAETKTTLTVTTAKGAQLIFDKATGIQTNAKNVKFANKIQK